MTRNPCIPSIQVPPDIKDKADAAAQAAGFKTTTEWARSLICKALDQPEPERFGLVGEEPNPTVVSPLLDAVWTEAHLSENDGGSRFPLMNVTNASLRRALKNLRERYNLPEQELPSLPRKRLRMLDLEFQYLQLVADSRGMTIQAYILQSAMRAALGDAPLDSNQDQILKRIDATYLKLGFGSAPWYLNEEEMKTIDDAFFQLLTYTDAEWYSFEEAKGRAEAITGGRETREWAKSQVMKEVYHILSEPSPFEDTVLACQDCRHKAKDPEFRDRNGAGKATCPMCGSIKCFPVKDLTGAEPDTSKTDLDLHVGEQAEAQP